MPPIGPEHSTSNALIGAAIGACLPDGWIVRLQDPVTLSGSEPEPDIVVARGTFRDYARRHPGAADIALVIEVADATLAFDRTKKAAQYAAAGIPEYWIVNLLDRQIEVHRDPATAATGSDYRIRESLAESQSIGLTVEGRPIAQLRVADLLP
jgi:Uma2 family endonuclease